MCTMQSSDLSCTCCVQEYVLPLPVTEEYLASIHKWVETPESEDLEERRIETYGIAGGTIFGVVSGGLGLSGPAIVVARQ